MKKIFSVLCLSILYYTQLYSQGPGCPNIDAGADQVLPCNVNCTTLNATFFQTGVTTNYTVTSIPYAPPAPTTSWVNSFVNIDDRWSGIINLPFNFCYYGNVYNKLVIGANGVISFNTAYANGFCPWSYTASVPSASLPLNAIFGAYHDIDPSVCGQIRYAISGTYPCRTFMFDFNAVCHYSCNSLKTTQRIVLYETSNTIEVYIGNKPTCNGWNGGRAVIGIQNAAGDVGLVAPGRQTGNWSASNEGWRFTPSGLPNYQIQWYSSTSPAVLGTGTSINVCPTSTYSTYSAILTYTNCDNSTVVVSDQVGVTLTGPAQPPIFANSTLCSGATLTLNTPTLAGATYVWAGPNGFSSNAQNPTIPNVSTANSGNYTLYVVVNGCTSSVATRQITVISGATLPAFSVNSPCANTTLTFDAATYTGATYVWSGPGGWNPGNVEDPTRPNATTAMSGSYSLYIVINGCTSGTTTQNVVINPIPATPNFTTNSPVCTSTDITFNGPTVANATYVWSGPGGWSANIEDPTRQTATLGMSGTYGLNVVVNGCSSAVATQNVVVNGADVPVVEVSSSICAGDSILLQAQTVPGATYVWSGPNGFTSSDEDPVLYPATPAMAGTYSLYLVSNGCTSTTATGEVVVNGVSAPAFTFTSPLCNGDTLVLDAPTITNANYYWTAPGWTSFAEDTTIYNVTGANSGNYSLYVVLNECTSATSTQAITVNPIPATPTIGSNSPICSGNPLNLTSNTYANSTYVWSGPNGFTSALEDPTRNPADATMSGNYSLYVVTNSCTSATQSLTAIVNTAPTLISSHTDVNCQGDTNGTAHAEVSIGGTPPFQYAWNLVPPQLTQDLTNIGAGTYIVGVLDSLGCTDQDTVVVSTLSTPPTIQGSVTNETCFGSNNGAVNVTITGGSPNFSYLWNSGQNTEDISNVAPGNYTITVTDQYQCPYTSSYVIQAGPDLVVQRTVNNIPCFGGTQGSIQVQPSGGTPPYTITVNGNVASGTLIQNLPAGTYVVVVNDNGGCSKTVTATISAPPQIVGDSTYHQIRLGDYLTLSPTYSGGTGNLSMYWTPFYNLSCSNCADPLAWPTQTTTYHVNITDANGCTGTGIVVVDVFHDGPFIPNTFTPGQGDINEVFRVSDYGVKEFELYIFDRWGEKLFYSENIYQGWDGRQPNGQLYPLDVYVWKTHITYIDGTQKTLMGHITLLR